MQQSKNEYLITIVDDDSGVRNALQRLLRSAGFSVESFSSGEDFIRRLPARKPDCLLLDLHLPALNGFEVLRQLMILGAKFPVIVITGGDAPGMAERTLAAGASGYLLKPLEDDKLLSAVRKALHSGT